jgi:hypothetical protein
LAHRRSRFYPRQGRTLYIWMYSETCEIRTPLGRAISIPNSEVSSFHRAICTENSSLGPDEGHRMSSFRRVVIHRFHCIPQRFESALAKIFRSIKNFIYFLYTTTLCGKR